MKKIIVLFALIGCNMAHAQDIVPLYDQEEMGFEVKPANLSLEADKHLCELKETVNVNIRITMADKENGVPRLFNYKFKDPTDAPWTVGAFKVISGGASVVMTDGGTAQLQMPSQMPKEKAVLVQVTLHPLLKGNQEVQLFTTIYLADNENVFYFNCPYLQINNEKYIISNKQTALSTPDSIAAQYAKKKPPVQNATMTKRILEYTGKAAVADITTTVHGFDMTAITSNTKAIYAKDEDLTSILINGNTVAMENGKSVNKRRMFLIALSVPGKTTGAFTIKSNKKISATITLPEFQPGYACACQEDPDGDNKAHCLGGSITITKYDGKYVEGTLVAHLESSDYTNPPTIFFATLHGRFKVLVGNAQ